MQLFRKLDDVPASFGPTVLSVGNFDGVHRAHQLVLKEVVARAKKVGAKAMAVTFDPHPMRVLRPDVAPKLLTLLPEKLKLLELTGLDAVLVLPFTRDLSLTTPSDFATELLGKRLKAKEVHEGESFHFGHKAEGNVQKLKQFGQAAGYDVVVYPELRTGGDVVSSSRIRELLREGQVGRARRLLGRVFSVISTPGRGRGYGHKYTVPTINLARYDELVPKDGVYITRTRVGDELFDSVTNVGNRPTFGADSFAIETHLLNFHPIDVLAETRVELCFLRRLRDEIKFPSVDALRDQIGRDVNRARRYFRLLGDGR
ncbi:MAG: bifunctional riboflavin kinase/FAD synthetase [Candidatus Koribacter versatilis]|uniref:Riboflavin biosynthesis protein n=1 Tax=Candidatus Korobacter versatilis TaxID=658062 RepID=A0A932EQE9_9BACT|nr:bifunctional riboflavin kinase/FAD synthetase [Candidatus Koribacter versatilis]